MIAANLDSIAQNSIFEILWQAGKWKYFGSVFSTWLGHLELRGEIQQTLWILVGWCPLSFSLSRCTLLPQNIRSAWPFLCFFFPADFQFCPHSFFLFELWTGGAMVASMAVSRIGTPLKVLGKGTCCWHGNTGFFQRNLSAKMFGPALENLKRSIPQFPRMSFFILPFLECWYDGANSLW